jgi:anaerobic magnesium-protoporphyrin IX monomethyl ester cyclase
MSSIITLLSTTRDYSGIGSRVLSAWLRNLGYDTRLVFLPSPGGGKVCSPQAAQAIADLCKTSNFVGLSVFTSDFNLSVQISRALRQHTNAGIIWGGIHPTARPVECLEHADLVCVGEGELALKSLLEGNEAEEIPGLWTRGNGDLKQTGPGQMIVDISTLPHQDFSFEGHFAVDPDSGQVNDLTRDFYLRRPGKKLYKDLQGNRLEYYRTVSSRGCPMACTYCSNEFYHRLYTRRHYRLRTIEDLLDELRKVKAENDFVKLFCITEDNFLARPPHEIRRFADRYRMEIGLPFYTVGHPIHVTRERLDPLLEAGLIRLSIGIQSGSVATLKRYRRPGLPKHVLKAAEIISSYQGRLLPSKYDVISNDPLQTPEEARESVLMLSHLQGKLANHPMILLPGTAINEQAHAAGLEVDRRLEGYEGYIPRVTNYYEVLLRLINVEYFPRWGVRALARPTLYRAGQRWPVLNRVALGVVKVMKKAGRIARKS